MPRGRGIYRDESRDKLAENLDAAEDEQANTEADSTTARDTTANPEPPEPPD